METPLRTPTKLSEKLQPQVEKNVGWRLVSWNTVNVSQAHYIAIGIAVQDSSSVY